MTQPILLLVLSLGCAAGLASAQDSPRPPDSQGGHYRPHLLPRGAEQTLNLSDDQRQQLKDLEDNAQKKLEQILTPAQMDEVAAMRPQGPPPPPPEREQGNRGPRNRNQGLNAPAPQNNFSRDEAPRAAANNAPSQPLPAGVIRVPVTFSGGHDTVPVDHGRPVKLIAAAFGVPDEVFRETFSHVHPAGPGSGGPTDAEARTNKAALMNGLGKYGITNDRINTVSNFYRYPPGSRNLWRNQPASANALVKDGHVVGFEITHGGYGYTTVPTVSVPGLDGVSAQVKVSYGKNFETNGAVSEITLSSSK
jgi:hypothetical protein